MPEHSTSGNPSFRRVWIFQGNPNKYNLRDSLRDESEELWNVRQNKDHIRSGDVALIWFCGAEAGIYAAGTVMNDPIIQPDSIKGQNYWIDPLEAAKVFPRVRVRYDRKMLDTPLTKDFLNTDPALSDLSILRFAQGTNFPVTQQEWTAICSWLGITP